MTHANAESAVLGRGTLPTELTDSTPFLLKRLGFIAKDRSLEAYEESGLHPYHHAILLALDESPRETQGAIADALGYDRGQLVGLLDDLESRGLVARRRDPADRRRHVVELTPEGRLELGRLRKLSRRLEDEFLAPLDPDDRRTLHELLLTLGRYHCPRVARSTEPA
jgi:MarR family transcriptional regulator, lower aerobic nicotinate degradation pathway regulator